MSNPPPVKTPFSAPAPAGATPTADQPVSDAPPRARPPAGESPAVESPTADPAADPKLATLIRLLRPIPEAKLHPAAETRLPDATGIAISLTDHRLRVMHHEEVLVEAPVSTGRSVSPTPEGQFTLAAKPSVPSALRYGHYRNKSGALLVRGVFPKIDPLPPEAVFDQVAPKGLLQLSEEGPFVFGGEATGAATTDGSVILSDKIALLLHEKLPLGLPVVIAR